MTEVIISQASKEFSRQLDDTMARWQSKWRKPDVDITRDFEIETLKMLKNDLSALKNEIQEIIKNNDKEEKNELRNIKAIIEAGYVIEIRKRNTQYVFSFWKNNVIERTMSNMFFTHTSQSKKKIAEGLRYCLISLGLEK